MPYCSCPRNSTATEIPKTDRPFPCRRFPAFRLNRIQVLHGNRPTTTRRQGAQLRPRQLPIPSPPPNVFPKQRHVRLGFTGRDTLPDNDTHFTAPFRRQSVTAVHGAKTRRGVRQSCRTPRPNHYAFRATVLILFQRLVQNRLVEVDIAAAGVGDEFGRRLVLRLGILDVRLGRHPILFALGRLTEQ